MTERRPPMPLPSHLGHRRQRSWMSSDEEEFFIEPRPVATPTAVPATASLAAIVADDGESDTPSIGSSGARRKGEYTLLINEEEETGKILRFRFENPINYSAEMNVLTGPLKLAPIIACVLFESIRFRSRLDPHELNNMHTQIS